MEDLFKKVVVKMDYPCQCTECSWKGHVSDCESYEDSDGWEYPTYTVPICPICGEDVEI